MKTTFLFHKIRQSPYMAVFFLVVIFFSLDIFFGQIICYLHLAERVVDIQSPSSLFFKLDYLNNFEGKKIVFLGDSVIYGRSMKEYGDSDWEKNSIPAKLSKMIKKTYPNDNILILNLGMNGALPTDLYELMRILKSFDIDLIIMDVTLRSFSKDFSNESIQMSRPWLKNIRFSSQGKLNLITDQNNGAFQNIENVLREFMLNFSNLYRARDFVQWFLFNNQPAQAAIKFRNKLNNFLMGKMELEEDPLILMFKAKSRYASISLIDENPQFLAFKNLLKEAELDNKKLIIFYAAEDQSYLENILDSTTYLKYLAFLEETIKLHGPNALYIPRQNIPKSYYADYVHLNKNGCSFMCNIIYDKMQSY